MFKLNIKLTTMFIICFVFGYFIVDPITKCTPYVKNGPMPHFPDFYVGSIKYVLMWIGSTGCFIMSLAFVWWLITVIMGKD
jgi:hypothetical protein